MSLLEHPDAQALLADAVVTPDQVRGCQDRITDLPATLPAALLPRRAADPRHARHPRPAQRAAAQDLRADRRRGRRPPQAGPELRRRRRVGRRGRHGRTPRPRPRGARPTREAVLILDPSGFPKSGSESCGVARQWCGRLGKQDNCQLGVFLAYAAPGGYAPLDRRLYLPEDWAADPVRRGEVPRPRGRDLPGVVADRRRPAGAVPQGPAPRLGQRRRRDGPTGAVPRLAAAARRAVRARRALQHERPRPGVPPPPAAACRPGPQAGGAVLPRRRLGGAATGLAVDPADGPRRRAGAAAGRRHDRAGAGQGGAAGRAGGAPGGDADGRGEAADRLRAEQRRPGGAAVRAGPGPVHAAPDRGGVRRGEGGSRAGAVRGAELGGLAPPHDVVAAGAVVPDPGAAAGRGGKPRR